MAEHAGTGGGLTEATDTEVPQRNPGLKAAVVVGAVALLSLGAVGGWLGYRIADEHRDSTQQSRFVQAARQGAINLTTIGHKTVDADIDRILQSSTGTFHEDFQKRAEPFADVVKEAQSTSEGTVTSVALESQDGDTAQVLVVMSVKMANEGAPEQVPSTWRMRIGVQSSGGTEKVSDVQFVS